MRRPVRRDLEPDEELLRHPRVMGLVFESPEQLEVLASRQAVVERRALRHPADPDAVDTLDRPGARLERAGEQREQGRLPRAVRADQRERLAGTNVDAGRLERNLRAKTARDLARAQDGVAQRLAAAGGGFASSKPTSTGSASVSSQGSSPSRSWKNSHIARAAASSGCAISAPGNP